MNIGQSGLRVGRLFGIEIRIDWSWLFIFVLVTLSLAVGVFPRWHPDWSVALNWTVGAAASLLFFFSILLHELAHSLVARARGIPVRRITLFLFGGVSNIEREPPSAGAEFWITVVGPLTSLVLGVFFWMLGGFAAGQLLSAASSPMQGFARLGPLSTLLVWLGPVNILVAVFNLIPGFPLDGGRILRAILWASTGDLTRATRWAAGVGQGVAWAFIFVGVAMVFGARVPVLGSGVFNGLWLAFIGWFLNGAAVASKRQVVLQHVLEDVPVSRLMRTELHSVPPATTVRSLVDDVLLGTDERAFPVTDNGHLSGLVCLEDVRKVPRDRWDRTSVSEIMTPESRLEVVAPNEEVADAMRKLLRRDVRQLPVLQDGHMVGMLRRQDVSRWLELQSEVARN